MHFERLRRGEKIAGVAGIALLIVMLLFDWYSVGAEFDGLEVAIGGNAWQFFSALDFILCLIALIAIGQAVLTATQRSPSLPVAASVATSVAGGLGTLLLLYRIVDQPGPNELANTKLGVFLGLIAVAAIAYGGFEAMREEDAPGIPQPEPEVRPAPATPAPAQGGAAAAATAAAGAGAATPPPSAGNPAAAGEGSGDPPALPEPLGTGPGEEPGEEPRGTA